MGWSSERMVELPEEYVGQDQILINSERIILSSKANEMIFFSKGIPQEYLGTVLKDSPSTDTVEKVS